MMLLARGLGACPVGSAVAGLTWRFQAHHLGLGHRTASPWGSLDSVGGARISAARPQAGAKAAWPLRCGDGSVPAGGEPFTSAMALFFALVVVLAAGRSFRPTPSALATTAKSVSAWMVAVAIAAVSWLLSVPYALVTDTGASEPGKTSAVNLLSHPLPHGSLLRLQDARPRVYLPGQIRSVPPAEAASHLLDEAVVGGQQVLLLTAGQPLLVPAVQADSRAPARWKALPHRLPGSTSSPTLAGFVEQYDPGWSALVDGKAAPLLRANLLMRASRCPPVPSYRASVPRVWAATGNLPVGDGLLGLVVLVATARGGPRRDIESRNRSGDGRASERHARREHAADENGVGETARGA